MKKSVISLISYDADLLPSSIRSYYDYVDEIVLGLDKDRKTWSKDDFSFDEDKLFSTLKTIDVNDKILIEEQSFSTNSDASIKNDNYERNYLKDQCSHDWIFSFDADEVLLNPKDFFYKFCPLAERYKNQVDLCMSWITPYKQIDDYTLLITEEDGSPFARESQGVVTSKDSTFVYSRWTDKSVQGHNRVLSPLYSLHYNLCRNNITHPGKEKDLDTWNKVSLDNYSNLRNFRTESNVVQWPKLTKVKTVELTEYILEYLGVSN